MVRGRQAEITEAGVTIHHGFGFVPALAGSTLNSVHEFFLRVTPTNPIRPVATSSMVGGMGHGCCRRIVLNGGDIQRNKARRGA